VLNDFEVHNYKSIRSLRMAMPRFMVLVGPNGAGKTNVVRSLELFGDLVGRGNTDPARELGWDQIIRREKRPARAGMTFRARVLLPPDALERARPARRVKGEPRPARADISVVAELSLAGSVGSDDVSARRELLQLSSDIGTLSVEATDQGVKIDPGDDPDLWRLATSDVYAAPRLMQQQDPETKLGAAALLELIFGERALAKETERRILRILSLQRVYSVWLAYFFQAVEVNRIRLDASSLRSDSILRDSSAADMVGPNGDNLAAAVDRLRGHGKAPRPEFTRVLQALQQVYPRIEDVRPLRVGSGRLTLIVKEAGISEALPQSSISDGVLHALALLVMLETPGGGVLAIEEPENAIHPWSVAEIVRLAQSRATRRQTILTTHSPVVVDAVADPKTLFIVQHEGSQGTTVRRADECEATIEEILRESGQRLGAVWIDGTLGGVPSELPPA
jgi:predicted ATPase